MAALGRFATIPADWHASEPLRQRMVLTRRAGPVAAALFDYLSKTEVQQDLHETSGDLPVTLAAYEATKASGFYDKNPGADIAVKQLTNKPPTANSKGLRFGNFVQGREVIEEEMENVLTGKKDAKTALDDAVKRGNLILRKFQAANK